MRASVTLGCMMLTGAAGCLNTVAQAPLTPLADAGPTDGGIDAGLGPDDCVDAGGTCLIGPPMNCAGMVLSAYDCNPDRSPGGAVCCLPMDAGVPDAGPLPDAGPFPDAGPLPDAGPMDAGPPDSGLSDAGPDAGAHGSCTAVDGGVCVPGSASNLDDSVTYPTGDYFQLASGDLNGDGILDLVGLFFIGQGFDVFLGLPDGGLGDPTNYPYGDGYAIAIGDLNCDGVPDVVASNGSGVNVFLNDGQGGLATPVFTAASKQVRSIGVGDFNGDGLPDLVLAELDPGSGAAELFWNQGAGAFSAAIDLHGQGSPWGGLVVADLNQDGLPDISVNSDDGGAPLMVLLSHGDGGFDQTFYPTSVGFWLAALPTEDGAPDLVVTSGTAIQVLKNSGAGSFTVGLPDSVPGGGWLTVGDFNGDCVPDLATSIFANCGQVEWGLSVLYGDGDGGFLPAVSLAAAGVAPSGMAPLGPVASPRALAVGDACGAGITVYGDASSH